MSADVHPTYIKGIVTLSDGTETGFSIQSDLGWQQWGNDQEHVGATVDLMDALAAAASEAGLREAEEEPE